MESWLDLSKILVSLSQTPAAAATAAVDETPSRTVGIRVYAKSFAWQYFVATYVLICAKLQTKYPHYELPQAAPIYPLSRQQTYHE